MSFMRLQAILTAPADRTARVVWLGLFLTITVWIVIGNTHSVTPAYHEAALHWLQGRNLYLQDGRGFLYLPQAAILSIPFALCPIVLGEIAWRALTIGLFAFGLRRFCSLIDERGRLGLFLPATLLVIPLCASGARNGQSTLVIAGLMMLAACEIARERWMRATLLLCLGFAFKPLTLVLMLLAAGVYRPLGWRLALGMLCVLVAPFLTQAPEYVITQYADCLSMLRSAAQLGIERPWAHLFGVLQAAGWDVPEQGQTAVRFACALLTLLLARSVQRSLSAERSAVYLFGLAGCYLMLFNPRTENNTYALVAPIIGLLFAESLVVRRNLALATFLAIVALGIVGSYEVGRRLIPDARPVWLAPTMCGAFTIALCTQILMEVRRSTTLAFCREETRAQAQDVPEAPAQLVSSPPIGTTI